MHGARRLLAAALAAAAAAVVAAQCDEPAECSGFADHLPAQTQFGHLTCDSQYRQVDKTAPPGLTVKMVCPRSCGACPKDVSDLSDEERCLASPHCLPAFEVCLDGYGGFPDCKHMPQATGYDGKTNPHGQPQGYGSLQCALNEAGYLASDIDTAQLRAQMARHHACEYVGEFLAGERHGDGVFKHSIQASAEGGKFAYEYDGEWEKDVKHGSGKLTISFTLADLSNDLHWTFEGDWADGLPHGTGRLENTDGSVYNGPLRQGVPHGFGTLCAGRGKDAAACMQIEFEQGLATGEGTLVADGQRYALDCGTQRQQQQGENNDEEVEAEEEEGQQQQGGGGSDCFLRPRDGSEDGNVSPSLRFANLVELRDSVLPAALLDGLVASISDREL